MKRKLLNIKNLHIKFDFNNQSIVAVKDSNFEIFKGERSSDELGGPIRIAELSSDFWDKGMQSTLWFMVIIGQLV